MANNEITPSSLYYLHANENPSLILVKPIIDGHNYHSWSRSMKMALSSKNKFGFVNGTIMKLAVGDRLHAN